MNISPEKVLENCYWVNKWLILIQMYKTFKDGTHEFQNAKWLSTEDLGTNTIFTGKEKENAGWSLF